MKMCAFVISLLDRITGEKTSMCLWISLDDVCTGEDTVILVYACGTASSYG